MYLRLGVWQQSLSLYIFPRKQPLFLRPVLHHMHPHYFPPDFYLKSTSVEKVVFSPCFPTMQIQFIHYRFVQRHLYKGYQHFLCLLWLMWHFAFPFWINFSFVLKKDVTPRQLGCLSLNGPWNVILIQFQFLRWSPSHPGANSSAFDFYASSLTVYLSLHETYGN